MGRFAPLSPFRAHIPAAAVLAIVLAIVVTILIGTPAHAVGWQPACNPLQPPPCAEEQDPLSAALTSLHHNYDPVVFNGRTSIQYDIWGHLSQFGALGTRTTIPFNVGGLATADCTGFFYMAMTVVRMVPRDHKESHRVQPGQVTPSMS